MAVKKTAQQASQAWQTNFAAAGPAYTAGINAVTVSPGQLAAAQQSLYVSQVQANAPKWASKVAAVPISTWKTQATTVGVQNLATGATKGAAKQAAFMQTFLPQLSSIVDALPARGAYAANKTRLLSYLDALHAKAGSF